jgi:hypothetical protein
MKITLLKITFFICLCCGITRAYSQQLSPQITQKYPQDIVLKVYKLLDKVSLTPVEQLAIANYYKKSQAQIVDAIKSGQQRQIIDSLIDGLDDGVKGVLSKRKLNEYRNASFLNKKDGTLKSGSKFAAVLKFSKDLNLTAGQVDSLLSKGLALEVKKSELKAAGRSWTTEAQAFEAAQIPKILSDEQYTKFFVLKNKDLATKWAVGDWQAMKLHGLSKRLDSTSVVNQLLNYNSNKLAAMERYKNEPEQLSRYVKSIEDGMPSSLRQLRATKQHNNPVGTNASTVKAGFAW